MLAGFRRDGAERGRGQAAPLSADAFAAILATADRRRETGRGRESARVAARRSAIDKALAAVLFQGALRRSEAAALEWRDVAPATTANAILVTVRRSKTDQEGTAADVRYLKDAAATAVLALRLADPAPTARVFGGLTPQHLGRRFTAAAAAAGLPVRLTAHSGRVGLASELTARGASTAPPSCGPARGRPPAWSPTTRPVPTPNAAPSPATSDAVTTAALATVKELERAGATRRGSTRNRWRRRHGQA